MSNIKIMAFVGALALGLLAGCQKSEDAPKEPADSSAAGDASVADESLLDGPVPQCPELTSPARRSYRIAAFQVCQQATTIDARMKNPGCLAKQKMSQCMGSEESRDYTLEIFKSEEREALQ